MENLTENILNDKEKNILESNLNDFKVTIDKKRYQTSLRYIGWLDKKVTIHKMSEEQNILKTKNEDKKHPIVPKRGEIYLAELGENIGKEINNQHLVIIIQNDKGNYFSNTTVCIPISSNKKLFKTHEQIEKKDIISGNLDIYPSKAKTEQICYLDKARLKNKIAVLSKEKMDSISKRLKLNLDIE